MHLQKPPLPLLILGWIAIIATPIALLVFGWRDIELTCRRPGPGAPPTCQVSETFAAGLFTRQVTAEQATGMSFQIKSVAGPGRPGTTTVVVVLATPKGEVPVRPGTSKVVGDAKQVLIGKMQEFLDTPNALEFSHHARLHSLFGYLGMAGVAGLLLAVVWYLVRRRWGGPKPRGDG